MFWVDERVVPKDHADSNYRLASDQFLSKVSTCSVKFINMFDCETAGLFYADLILVQKRDRDCLTDGEWKCGIFSG